jgi:hypothetical protein
MPVRWRRTRCRGGEGGEHGHAGEERASRPRGLDAAGRGGRGSRGAAALAACVGAERGDGAQSAQSAAPYTLVWGLRTSATPENTQAAIRDFRDTRPHVTVDTFDASGGIDQIMQQLATASPAASPLTS